MKTMITRTARKSTAFRSGPPVAPVRQQFSRRPFGQGILPSVPNYRLDCTLEDDAWWMEEARREEDKMFDRLAEQAEMDARWDGWYC